MTELYQSMYVTVLSEEKYNKENGIEIHKKELLLLDLSE